MKLVLLICYHFQHMITYLLKIFSGEREKKSNLRESYPSWFTIGCGKGKSARTDQAKKKLKRNILLKFYKEKDMPRLS